jgi:RNA polymerase subunit RPABC4/transcription elongation factor Spt4
MYNLVCCRCGRTYESDRELGIYCPICQALEKAEIAAREARTITRGVEYGEFFREDSVFCPHCGREMDPGDDCDLYNEGDHERKCGCGKVF